MRGAGPYHHLPPSAGADGIALIVVAVGSRSLIAQAIRPESGVLLLDEPTSNYLAINQAGIRDRDLRAPRR